MKYCILTPRFPFPENGGDVLRINNIAKYLKSAGHELVLVSFCEGNPDMAAAKTLYDKIYVVKRKKTNSMLYSLEYMLSGRPIQCGYYYSREYSKLLGMVIAKEKPDRFVSHLGDDRCLVEDLYSVFRFQGHVAEEGYLRHRAQAYPKI